MNTNGNIYTIIYTTVIVVVVAALLAFVSQSLKGKQDANEKAETISQMLTAAGYGTKADMDKLSNTEKLDKYAAEIQEAFLVGLDGEKISELGIDRQSLQVRSPKELKRQNYNIKGGANQTGAPELPVFIFKNGRTVVPIYGAGLWGPIWGYISFEQDLKTISGAYFDHESETAGLGAKIKDDPAFQLQFVGEIADFGNDNVFDIVKGGAPKDASGKSVTDNKIDAISGATMTSLGLDAAIDTWLAAYAGYFKANESCAPQGESCCCSGCAKSCCAACPCEKCCTSDDCTVSCGESCCRNNCGCCGENCCETKTEEVQI